MPTVYALAGHLRLGSGEYFENDETGGGKGRAFAADQLRLDVDGVLHGRTPYSASSHPPLPGSPKNTKGAVSAKMRRRSGCSSTSRKSSTCSIAASKCSVRASRRTATRGR